MPGHPATFKTNLNLARAAQAAKAAEAKKAANAAAAVALKKATNIKHPGAGRFGGPPAGTKRRNSRKTRKQRTRRNRH